MLLLMAREQSRPSSQCMYG